jgi:hypothetical protein
MNTSATGGFLRLSPVPGQKAPEQTDIEDVLQALIVGITGICGTLVRPRWQPSPPDEPGPQADWCAFGITRHDPHNFPVIRHHGAVAVGDSLTDSDSNDEGDGYDEITDLETLTVLASFYGPRHMDLARTFRVGLHVPQNRKILLEHNMNFTRAGSIVPVPALIAMQWRARADLSLTFQLMTSRTYAVLNLQQMDGTLVSDHSKNDSGKPGIGMPLGCQACPRACWREP